MLRKEECLRLQVTKESAVKARAREEGLPICLDDVWKKLMDALETHNRAEDKALIEINKMFELVKTEDIKESHTVLVSMEQDFMKMAETLLDLAISASLGAMCLRKELGDEIDESTWHADAFTDVEETTEGYR